MSYLTCDECREQYTNDQLCADEPCPKVACRGELQWVPPLVRRGDALTYADGQLGSKGNGAD